MTDAPPRDSHAVLVAVGPNPLELERLRDLADALAAHEPGGGLLVLVDDNPEPRDLDLGLSLPSNWRAVSVHHRRPESRQFTRGKGICSVILLGLQWIQAHTDAAFVLKLDTDSLVIGPYRQRILEAFGANPGVGKLGAYETLPHGEACDWSMHIPTLKTLGARINWRRPRWTLRTWNDPLKAQVRRVRSAAEGHGYRPAEHCTGGGYALSRPALDAMAAAGHLDAAMLWAGADLPEDVMVGLHVRAAGFGFADLTARGEVFGVRYIGLSFPPAELLARGYSVIHAVKNDPDLSEADIRSFFRRQRASRT